MKINVFRTQCRIGSKVRYKGKEKEVADIKRQTYEVKLSGTAKWLRCSEVELVAE